jgi:hydrogenase maturation factor
MGKYLRDGCFAAGKLPVEFLERMLKMFPCNDEAVVIGPAVGMDAAALNVGGKKYLLVTTDPITFTTDEIGWYAVCVNANDIAVMGGMPGWFFATLLLQEGGAAECLVRSIFSDLRRACRRIGITLCGGHTEITSAVTRPVICGTMIGEVGRRGIITAGGARPGDAIILTKGLGIEGTAILARERRAQLKKKIPADVLKKASGFLHRPGISVVRDAMLALEAGHVTAMHDPTEGGVATALREMGIASGVGARIYGNSLPIRKETRLICEALKINPLGLISSGALLVTCRERDVEKILRNFSSRRISASRIGEVRPAEEGFIIVKAGEVRPLPQFSRDEIARYFSKTTGGSD